MNNWKIATFVFAFLFLAMLMTNVYQRQFVLSDEEYLNYQTEVNETVIVDEDNTIREGYMLNQEFALYYDALLDLSFISDNPANIYIMESDEFERYELGETSYYVEKGLSVESWSLNEKYVQAGTYMIVVEAVESEVNYHIKLVAK